jgi:hypothetical protein
VNKIIPRTLVADVMLGMDATSLQSIGYFEDISRYDDILNWKTFKKNDDFECYIKNDIVICIAFFRNCSIDKFSIIGKTPSELIGKFGNPDEIGEPLWVSDDMQQTPYEYDSFGLQVWFEAGTVISVFCTANNWD